VTNLDEQIRELCAHGDYEQATTVALTRLGPGIFRYLVARTKDHALASEAFAEFGEDLWRGISGFRGESSVRVWAFTVARNALGQALRQRGRERKRSLRFTSSSVARLTEQVRTETLAYLKTETKERFARIRESLSIEEQSLLHLRVNEQMSWDDIARIQFDCPDDATVKRHAAKLRKRFQLLRDKLRQMAEAEGLLGKDDEDG
jgi:RNA polymerase sigma-70 factor, ECF subfamily